MAGFQSNDNIINSLTTGKTHRQDWSKNFNPTTAAVANEFHTLFRGNGNPGPDALFDTGANLTFIPVTDQTTGAASIQHGGNVSPDYKSLLNVSAYTAAAGTAPVMAVLVDVIGYYRKTSVTVTGAQATTNTLAAFSEFTTNFAVSTSIATHTNINLMPYTRVQLTTTTTLPNGLNTGTDYYIIKVTDTTCKFASSYANAVAGTAVTFSDDGTGTHTINTLLPRYTNGAGLQAIFFNPASTAMGAATPNLSLVYTNAAQTGSRATPGVLPVGKTAASNSIILYTGATAAGKYNYAVPLAGGDTGIAQIDSINNSTNYLSGTYTVALIKELCRVPVTTLGIASERDLLNQIPSLPRIYDGAALYWIIGSSTTTPANSAFSGHIQTIWN